MSSETAFLCDKMLGSLCRWLRMAGFDAAGPDDMNNDALKEKAIEEKRILLTRNGTLASSTPRAVEIENHDTHEQVKEVLDKFPPDKRKVFSRCTSCNGKLFRAEKSSVKESVPAGVFEHNEQFWKCDACGKIYWHGTHHEKIMDVIGPFLR